MRMGRLSNKDIIVVAPRNTRAANRKKYRTEKYENAKYKNSPYYKTVKLWDTMPKKIADTDTLIELKRHLKAYFSFDDKYFVI